MYRLPDIYRVDLPSYYGRWYEVASIPQWFQRGCVKSYADYGPRKDGMLSITNTCQLTDGTFSQSHGYGWPTDQTNRRLKVTFPSSSAPPGDYWILDIGPYPREYDWSLVGSPDKQSLWLLTRSPDPPRWMVNRMLRTAKSLGYDMSRIRFTR